MTKGQMLNIIKDLPDDTEVYIAHESELNPDIEVYEEVAVIEINHNVQDGFAQIVFKYNG